MDWSNAKIIDGKYVVPKRPERLKESDFKHICQQFKGTIFEDIYEELKEYYDVGRLRLIKSNPHTCLSWHDDDTNRVHYPIKTQQGCFMVMGGHAFHLEQNNWYMTYTKNNLHTAFNASDQERIHLVASIIV